MAIEGLIKNIIAPQGRGELRGIQDQTKISLRPAL